jgi:hypothetical protein
MSAESGDPMRATCLAVVPLLGALLCACSSTPTERPRLAADQLSFDGLARVENPVAGDAWIRPGFTLDGYTKIMLVGAGIEYRPLPRRSRTAFPLTEAQQTRLRDTVADAFRSELGKSTKFQLTDAAGPDTLTIWGGLIDVVSHVPPAPMGRGEIYLRSVGAATLVVEIRDSQSNAPLVRIVDRRAAGSPTAFQSNAVNSWSEVQRLARTWAQTLVTRLDAAAEWDQ